MSKAKKELQPLSAYMKQKARAACSVCKLAPEIRQQLGKAATDKGFTRADQLEWLKAIGENITMDELTAHFNRRHDEEAV